MVTDNNKTKRNVGYKRNLKLNCFVTLLLHIMLPRDIMLSRCILSSCPFVCLYVRPSVKVSIDKQRITVTETKWYNSAKLEVFFCCQTSH